MKIYDLLKKISSCFNVLGISYIVTGSIASIAYGESRFTNDIDVVADIKTEHIPGLLKHFPENEYYIDGDSIKNAIYREFQFNIIHPTSGLKVDVIIKKSSQFDNSRFERIHRFQFDDIDVNFASPEDVIIKKMDFYKLGGSEKHLRDIMSIIKISKESINFNYIKEWVTVLSLDEIWQAIEDRQN